MLPTLKRITRFERLSALTGWFRKNASLVLSVSLLFPAGLLILNEAAALKDYEESFEQVAKKQLESLSGALNQEIWNSTFRLLEKSATAAPGSDKPIFVDAVLKKGVNNTPELVFSRTGTPTPPTISAIQNSIDPEKFTTQSFLPVFLRHNESDWLIFALKSATDTLYFFCNPQSYVQREAEPVLEAVGSRDIGFELVFENAVLSKKTLKHKELVRKELWVFPGLYMRLGTAPTESVLLSSRRLTRASLLIGSALLIILLVMLTLDRIVKREKQVSRLKSDFVANVSHELKTPLSLIRMYAESLQMGRVSTEEQRQKYYGIIIRESERLSKLIHNVLELSRIEAGKKEYHVEACDINALISQTADTFQDAFEKNGFTISLELETNLPTVPADPAGISESLINLIDNAMKYSKDRKYLQISSKRSENEVVVSVQDSGIGLSKEDQDRIFEQFFRVESALTQTTRGTGLGLSLVHHFMKSQGGRVSVESEAGRGSTFFLHFSI